MKITSKEVMVKKIVGTLTIKEAYIVNSMVEAHLETFYHSSGLSYGSYRSYQKHNSNQAIKYYNSILVEDENNNEVEVAQKVDKETVIDLLCTGLYFVFQYSSLSNLLNEVINLNDEDEENKEYKEALKIISQLDEANITDFDVT